MSAEKDALVIGTAVKVPVGDGQIWRLGWITAIDGERVTVDLGRDGPVTVTHDKITRL
ncbi:MULTISPECIES: hypothetical protein [unclassified Frankia]|uniref:hypothetical protein n=1 Tax=unclassified Frankia TaxID=2632575 RepID=UPI002AD30AC4|nr:MULTISPECIES: hypothetical protein [unclassified Frankia]